MLDDPVGVIETLQQRIRDHGATLRENETRTRMALSTRCCRYWAGTYLIRRW